MSGLEIAGIILGAFPLIITAYDKSDSIIRGISILGDEGFSRELRKLNSKLRTQKAIFRSKSNHLQNVIHRNRDKISKALSTLIVEQKASTEHGRDGSILNELLRSCQETLEYIQTSLTSISSTLSQFSISVKRVDLKKVQLAFTQSNTMRSIDELQSFITSFSELGKEISNCLSSLDTESTRIKTPQSQQRSQMKPKVDLGEYKKIQHASLGLFDLFSQDWRCVHHDQHKICISSKDCFRPVADHGDVSLVLAICADSDRDQDRPPVLVEVLHEKCAHQDAGEQEQQAGPQPDVMDIDKPDPSADVMMRDLTGGLDKGSNGTIDQLRRRVPAKLRKREKFVHFHVNVPFNTTTAEDGSSSRDAKQMKDEAAVDLLLVTDICNHFERQQFACRDRQCLGYLQDHCTQRFYTKPALSTTPYQPRTLSDIISTSQTALMPTLSRAIMIELAGALANVMLQFHATPWLPEWWESSDISFFCSEDVDTGDISHIESLPYVTSNFARPKEDKGKQRAGSAPQLSTLAVPATYRLGTISMVNIRNERLFCLGVALLELGYTRSWERLRTKALVMLPQHQKSDYYAAERLAKHPSLARQMGPAYVRVILKCIGCDFGLGERDLASDELQERYVADVVDVLRDMEEGIAGVRDGIVRLQLVA